MSAELDPARGRVVGIGGVFLKSPDHERLRSWYEDNFGFKNQDHGVDFKWRSATDPAREHQTVWCIFPQAASYFDPSRAPVMINYIVDDLDAFLAKLSENGVEIDPKREDHPYGRFAWVFDADGNKIELWEPPAAIA